MASTHQHQHEFAEYAMYNFASWAHGPSFHDPCLPIASMERYVQGQEDPWHMRQHVAPHFDSSPLQSLPHSVFYDETYGHRLASPSESGPSSIDTGSGMSDYHSEPRSSPPFRASAYMPDLSSMSITPPYFNGHNDVHTGGGVVSMTDVQFKADYLPEAVMFEEDSSAMFFTAPPAPEEGYQQRFDSPQQQESQVKCEGDHHDTAPIESTESVPMPQNIRQRIPPKTRTVTSPVISSRVTKRPSGTRRRSSSTIKSPTKESMDYSSSNRCFPCVFIKYGCSSTFGSKNEWKRHVVTQHMRPGFWRCDLCETSNERKPNDFNRKDLFIQHVRRMHESELIQSSGPRTSSSGGPRSPKNQPEDQHLASIATRCYIKTRSLPEESGCHFCEQRFQGRHTWEDRMEHVGTHMEARKREKSEPTDPATWKEDTSLHEYLKREGIVERKGKIWVLVGPGAAAK